MGSHACGQTIAVRAEQTFFESFSRGEKRRRLRQSGFIAVTAVLALASTVQAQQNTSSTTANATARIITPISITKSTDLNFGDVVPTASSGTVVVTPAGARSATGGATLGSSSSVSAASFTVAGQANAAYTVTLPSSATITSGANSMTVNTFTSTPSGTGNLGAGASQTLSVGATLQVGANQAIGTYTGTFSVSVAYN